MITPKDDIDRFFACKVCGYVDCQCEVSELEILDQVVTRQIEIAKARAIAERNKRNSQTTSEEV